MKRLSLSFKSNHNGSQDLTIHIPAIRLRPDGNSRMWWMVDLEQLTRQKIQCGKMKLRAKLVVKLYCKIPENLRTALHRQRVLESIRSRSPLLMT